MELLAVADVADRLGVSDRQVRRLAEAGALRAQRVGGRWLVDADVVRRRGRAAVRPGRPVSPPMAWAALQALDPHGPGAAAVDARLRHRLRAHLAAAPPVEQWERWLRRRAEPRRLWVHPGVVEHLERDDRVRLGGFHAVAQVGLGLSGEHERVVYVRAADADGVIADHHAVPDEEGEVVLMVVPDEVPVAVLGPPGQPVPLAVGLVDLLASSDARERHAAASALEQARLTAGRLA